jgi:hypothetical protein
MAKFNVVVMMLCLVILIQQLALSSKVHQQVIVQEKVEGYSFPMHDGKVIIGTKAIKKENLERLVNVVGSSEKTQSLASRFGVEIEEAPADLFRQKEVVYDIKPWKTSGSGATLDSNPYILSQMLEELEDFFRRNPSLARDILKVYEKLKYKQWFWDKIEKFVEENK